MLSLTGGEFAQDVQEFAAPALSLWVAVWGFVREQLALLPAWARVGLVVFAIVALIASKWVLPAVADLARAKRRGR